MKLGIDIDDTTVDLANVMLKYAENITKMTLEKNKIPYNQLIMNAKHKLQFCIKHGISIFMDDSFDTCKELEENGIKTFLMTTKMNQNIKTAKMERVANWKEAYEKIKGF